MQLNWGKDVLHYTDEGTGDAVFFIHGLGGNADNWLHQRRALALHHRVIALDMPGHGRSSGMGVAFENYWAAAAAVLDHVGVECVSTVGLAMGARVGIALAGRRPDLARRLTLVNAYLTLPPLDHARRVELYDLLLQPGGDREWARNLLEGMGVTGHVGIVRGFMASLAQIDPAHVNAVFHQVNRAEQEEELRELDIPVQIMVGEQDHLVPASCTEELLALARHPRLHRFPCSGHLPYLQEPSSFNLVLEEFLHDGTG